MNMLLNFIGALMIKFPHWSTAYFIAMVSVGVATFVRWLLDPVIGNDHPLSLYYGSLIVTAWYGGWWPGLLALCTGYLAAGPLSAAGVGSVLTAH